MPEARQHWPHLVIAFTVAVALSLAWAAWTAARNGLSDLYARPAIDYLEQKRFDDYNVNAEEWLAIEASIAKATMLMPRNPQYLEALGLLHQLKLSLFASELDIEDMDAHAKAARAYFDKAVDSRPTWPYYWGNLALEDYRRGNYADASFSVALANASYFGPWKNDTQRLVMDLGSETWEFLSPGAQREFIRNVERGLHRQPQNTVRIVQDYGAWPKICDASNELNDSTLPHLRAICTQDRFAE